jgi:hypothetical protein
MSTNSLLMNSEIWLAEMGSFTDSVGVCPGVYPALKK